jgi:putative oxidoreductase
MIDVALLMLRMVVGGIAAAHGAQKLFGVWGGPGLRGWHGAMEKMNFYPPRVWALVSALGEFVGGLLFALGFLMPLGALAIMGSMLIAIIKAHWSKGFWNAKGGIEFPLALLTVAFAVGLAGPGYYALDNVINLRVPEPEVFVAGVILVALTVLLALNSAPLRALAPPRENIPVEPRASARH